jgi:hypothetical protein
LPTLRELQAAFARGVLDPGRAGALADRIVAGGLDPARRLAVYRDNVLVSLRRLLEGTFPATRRHLGPDRFADLALAFVRAEPPDRPQLLAYGAGFPAFLARAGAGPLAADLARLEWAREEACHAADAPPLDPATLAAIPQERYPHLRFVPHPSLRLVRSDGPVFSLWRAATADEAPPLPGAGPEQALVVRPAMLVATRGIGAADLLLVQALADGLPLAEAAERAQAADPAFDLQGALALHLTGGTFAGWR